MYAHDDIFALLTRAPLFLPMFALILLRVSGLMVTAPVFGSQVIPVRIRAGLAVAISFVLFPTLAPRVPADVTIASAVIGGAGELMIGLIIGLGLSIVLLGVQMAGLVIGQQAGIGLGEVVNPAFNTNTTLLGQMFFIVTLLVFLSVGGHREIVRAVLDTYETVPMLEFRAGPQHLELLSDLMMSSYALALRVAGPVLIALLFSTMAMGFLSRTMPQLNILSIGFILRSLIAFAATGLVIGAADGVLTDALADTFERLRNAFGLG